MSNEEPWAYTYVTMLQSFYRGPIKISLVHNSFILGMKRPGIRCGSTIKFGSIYKVWE